MMQSFPQCGEINNPSSTWTWLVISSLLGTSGFLQQLHVLVEIWTLYTHFLSNPGSDTCDFLPHVSKFSSYAWGVVSPLWYWLASAEHVVLGTSSIVRWWFVNKGEHNVLCRGPTRALGEGLSKAPVLQNTLQSQSPNLLVKQQFLVNDQYSPQVDKLYQSQFQNPFFFFFVEVYSSHLWLLWPPS